MYERVFGQGFVSPGGMTTTKVSICEDLSIVCLYKISFIAVDISSNLCGISGVKVWDHLMKGFPNLH